MATVMPAGSLAQIRLEYVLDGQLLMNTFMYEAEAEVADAQLGIQFATEEFLGDVWDTILQPLLSNEVTMARAVGQFVSPIRLVPFEAIPTIRNGGTASPALPSGVAMVIRKKSEFSGHRYRGRIYVGGLPSSAVDGSVLTAAFDAANRVNLSGLVTLGMETNAGGTATLLPVVGSYNPNVQPHTKSVVPVVQGELDVVLRYQRRREIGVGV